MANIDFIYLASLEGEGDVDALRAAIIEILRAGNMTAEAQRWLADMFDRNSDSAYKIEKLTRKSEGNPQDRKQGEERVDQLVELYRRLRSPANFVSEAVKLTGLSRETITKKYKPRVEKRVAEEAAEEAAREAEWAGEADSHE